MVAGVIFTERRGLPDGISHYTFKKTKSRTIFMYLFLFLNPVPVQAYEKMDFHHSLSLYLSISLLSLFNTLFLTKNLCNIFYSSRVFYISMICIIFSDFTCIRYSAICIVSNKVNSLQCVERSLLQYTRIFLHWPMF